MQHFYSVRGISTVQPPVAFQGSPNATITAINTSGGITISRTSGQTPCFVHVSASAISATGTSKPYEDLEFQWDFGDPSGIEIFTNPVTGLGVNMNTCQYGPEATYCYRAAGTKTIILTIRGRSGGGFTSASSITISASVAIVISVSSFNTTGGEFWFDQVNGNDANNGTSSGTPKQSLSALNALIASNTSFHLAKGSNWTGTVGIQLFGADHSGIRLDAYGSGANPIVNINGGGTGVYAFYCQNGGSHPQSDIVLSNLNLQCSTGSANLTVAKVYAALSASVIQDVYFDNVDQTSNFNASVAGDLQTCIFQWSSPTTMFNNGIWGGSITSPQTSVAGGNTGGLFGGAINWFFVTGTTISGGSNSTTFQHHIYPNCQSHVHFRYDTFGNGPGRGYCINGNFDQIDASLDYAQFWLMSENYFSGTQFAIDLSNGNENPSQSRLKNIVVQQNAFTNLAQAGLYFMSCCESVTVRDNKAWAVVGPLFSPNTSLNGGFLAPQLYRNKIYSTVNNSTGVAGIGTSADVAPNAVTVPWTVTDNTAYGAAVTAALFDMSPAQFQSNVALIDRNQWWAPNDSDAKFLGIRNAPITFAAWQGDGFDLNGSVANPNWPGPANGNFG